MQLLKMTKPQCTLYSSAMLLNVDPGEIVEYIGHDGLPDGLHIQQVQDYFVSQGKVLFPVEAQPCLPAGPVDLENPILRFMAYLEDFSGILICDCNGVRHAVAWNHHEQLCYDPNGKKYTVDECTGIYEIWCMVDLNPN